MQLVYWTKVGDPIELSFNHSRWSRSCPGGRPVFLWRKDAAPLPLQGPTIAVRSVTRADAGTYTCRARLVGDGCDGAPELEESFVLGVATAPATKAGLVPATTRLGGRFELTVNLTQGSPLPSFQWRRNGVDIPGATSQQLVIEKVAASDVGTYTCFMRNMAGEVEWEEAALGVDELESESQPEPATEAKGEL